MLMGAAEALRDAPTLAHTLKHLAQASARSALLHAGWLVQAQLGIMLSWSWFGGLGGVALWWALLALWPKARSGPSRAALMGGALAACVGLVLAMLMGRSVAGLLGWGLHVLAWAWLCSRLPPVLGSSPRGLQTQGWLGLSGGMLLAAGLAASPELWQVRWPLLCALLLLAPWLAGQSAAPLACVWAGPMERPDLAMGLMMGSLLPMGWWCASQGWNGSQSLTLHLCAMVSGAWLACRLAGPGLRSISPAWAWSGAALLCAEGSVLAMLAAAALVAAGSALRTRTQANSGAWALAGCALLLSVGHWSATWGPDALRVALLLALLLAAMSSIEGRHVKTLGRLATRLVKLGPPARRRSNSWEQMALGGANAPAAGQAPQSRHRDLSA